MIFYLELSTGIYNYLIFEKSYLRVSFPVLFTCIRHLFYQEFVKNIFQQYEKIFEKTRKNRFLGTTAKSSMGNETEILCLII